jgi:hypothetical protein
MQVEKLEVDRSKAKELHALYHQHRKDETAMDAEIRKAYKEIGQGRMIIRALASIEAAGLFTEGPYVGYPKLAIARADSTHCEVDMGMGRADIYSFTPKNRMRRFGDYERSHAQDRHFKVHIPGATWEGRSDRGATMPMIPPHLRPKKSLQLYHVLWEAEWNRRVPPRDPYLLRRLGGDMWIVVAAWDLSEVERAAMAHRLNG